MIYIKNILVMIIISLFTTCTGTASAEEKPSEMFTELFENYVKTEYVYKSIESRLDDGADIFIFDINKISKDVFCLVTFLATLGQTQYLVYKRNGENIWYFYKKAFFYKEPYQLENAEILNTYFKYTDNVSYAFNDLTGKYDIRADTDKYRAIPDVRSLAALIEIVQDAISN